MKKEPVEKDYVTAQLDRYLGVVGYGHRGVEKVLQVEPWSERLDSKLRGAFLHYSDSQLPYRESKAVRRSRFMSCEEDEIVVSWSLVCAGLVIAALAAIPFFGVKMLIAVPLIGVLWLISLPVNAGLSKRVAVPVVRPSRYALSRSERREYLEKTVDIPEILRVNHMAYREEALPCIAAGISRDIAGSPAWQSRYCDLDRIRLNLREEVSQITTACARLRTAYQRISKTTPTDAAVIAQVADTKKLLGAAGDVVQRRVSALADYRDGLRNVEGMLASIAAMEALPEAHRLATDIFADMVIGGAAADRTEKMTEELADTVARVQAQVEFIEANIVNSPELEAPLMLVRAS